LTMPMRYVFVPNRSGAAISLPPPFR
jgi:hypothetical protein